MKTIKIAGICVTLALLASPTLTSTARAAASGPEPAKILIAAPFPGSTAPGHPDSLRARELSVLAHTGIAPKRAAEALSNQESISKTHLLRTISAAPAKYGGDWFDPASAQMHIGVVSQAGRRAAERLIAREGLGAEVTVTSVSSTMAQLLATQRHWNRRLVDLFAHNQAETSLAPQYNAVTVTLGSSVSRSGRTALKRAAAASAVKVRVVVAAHAHLLAAPDAVTECKEFEPDKAYCNKPITAGVSIQSRNLRARCTAGPLAIPKNDKNRTYLLTAGHCIQKGLGNAMWFAWDTAGGARKEIGRAARQFINGAAGDTGAIDVSSTGQWVEPGATPVFAVTAQWKRAEGKSYAVEGEREAAVGLSNCLVGQTSGGTCGKIKATGVTFGTTKGLVEEEGGAISAPGDSGGPAVGELKNGNYLMEGTDVAHTTGNDAIWEPLGTAFELLTTLKLELLTTANETRGKETAKEKEEDEKYKKDEKEGGEEVEKIEKEEKEAAEKEGNPTVEPMPTISAPLEFTESSGKVVLESAKRKIECKESTGGGLLGEVRTGTLTMSLLGCKSTGVACHSIGEKGETIVLDGSVALVDLEKGKLVLGVEFSPSESYAECALVSLVLKGGVIGEASGAESGKKVKTVTLVFKQEKGKQAIKECHLPKAFCEGVKYVPEEALKGGAFEEAGLEGELKLSLAKEAVFSF